MKKQAFITILLIMLMSMVGAKTFAYDFEQTNVGGKDSQYLTFIARESGSFSFNGTRSNAIDNSRIYYSLDNGSSWTSLDRYSQSPIVQAGNKIMFKGVCIPIFYWVDGAEASIGIGVFSSTGRFDAEGNIMSLLYGDNFVGQTNLTGKDFAFYDLFATCAGLLSTANLVLPATILSKSCYEGMFRSCTSLTSTPQLPAITLAESCYTGMFWGCTSLTLTPQLPALTLDVNCYASMFGFCTSLTTAPLLPATTLSERCYKSMFDACTSLKEITCLATNISASECTLNWVRNVPSSGTFIKASNMNSWTRGSDGIPDNWTISNYSQPSANDFYKDGFTYHVDDVLLTAEVTSFDQSTSNVSIPEYVSCNDKSYRVTSIGRFAFYQCRNIISVIIPGSVTTIGSSAFEDCVYLTSLTLNTGLQAIGGSAFEGCIRLMTLVIPSTVNTIQLNAFMDCLSITDVYCYSTKVPNADVSAFNGVATENVKLHVLSGTVNAYRTTLPWSDFKEIVAMDADGIIKVKSGDGIFMNSDVNIYDLQGNRLDYLRKGINIIRHSNGKMRKVLVQ